MIDGLLGDAAEATTHVAQSFAQHESVCSLGAVDPSYDRVRGDARFRAVVRARWVCRTSARFRRSQVPRLRPRERLDAVGRQREAEARVLDAGPRQPRAHAIAAVQ